MKFLIPEQKKESNVLKIVLISAGVTVAVIGILLLIKKFFCNGCCCNDDCCCDDYCDCEDEKCDCCDCDCTDSDDEKDAE